MNDTYMLTYTGKIFDFTDPRPEMICIEDIAHHLALTNRYNGATKFPYNVAQHCILAIRFGQTSAEKLAILLHDATEAYIGDIVSPWKRLLFAESNAEYLGSVKTYELNLLHIIYEALDLKYRAFHGVVDNADKVMLATEAKQLLKGDSHQIEKYYKNVKPDDNIILNEKTIWGWFESELHYLRLFKILKEELNGN